MGMGAGCATTDSFSAADAIVGEICTSPRRERPFRVAATAMNATSGTVLRKRARGTEGRGGVVLDVSFRGGAVGKRWPRPTVSLLRPPSLLTISLALAALAARNRARRSLPLPGSGATNHTLFPEEPACRSSAFCQRRHCSEAQK